ncbi:hypothetical protein, partial [Streptomyces benahoarensis]
MTDGYRVFPCGFRSHLLATTRALAHKLRYVSGAGGKEGSQRSPLLEIHMQLKLKLTVVAAIAAFAGVASAQEQVVK